MELTVYRLGANCVAVRLRLALRAAVLVRVALHQESWLVNAQAQCIFDSKQRDQ